MKKGKCKNRHCSTLSNAAWCDLNSKDYTHKLNDLCHNAVCKCQKKLTFTPRQFQFEGAGFKNTMKKIIEGTEKKWNSFIEPELKIASPIISAGFVAKTENTQAGEVTSNDSIK